jgi:DNA-binding protein HU-beta
LPQDQAPLDPKRPSNGDFRRFTQVTYRAGLGRVVASDSLLERISMNISDLVDAVAATDSKLTKAQAKAAIEATFAAIRDAAAKGDEVSVPGFGKFAVQSKPARTGRNPSTGATIQIAASKALKFKPAKALKDALG